MKKVNRPNKATKQYAEEYHYRQVTKTFRSDEDIKKYADNKYDPKMCEKQNTAFILGAVAYRDGLIHES